MKKKLNLILFILLSLSYISVANACVQSVDPKETYSEHTKKALKKLLPLAEEGNVEATYTIGLIYSYDNGIIRDFEKGVKWLTKAADLGKVIALNEIGSQYYWDWRNHNYKKAFEYYKLAAEKGDYHAQQMLGRMYSYGHGITQDIEQSIYWYTKQASHWSFYAIAHIYIDDMVTTPDPEKALYWLTKAAEHGNRGAQLELSLISEDEYYGDYEESCPQGCGFGYLSLIGRCIKRFW